MIAPAITANGRIRVPLTSDPSLDFGSPAHRAGTLHASASDISGTGAGANASIDAVIDAETQGFPVLVLSLDGVPQGSLSVVRLADQAVTGSLSGDTVLRTQGGRLLVSLDGGNTVAFWVAADGLHVPGGLSLAAIPTTDPHAAGQVFRTGNTLMVSTG